jgi:hypothetical protein
LEPAAPLLQEVSKKQKVNRTASAKNFFIGFPPLKTVFKQNLM